MSEYLDNEKLYEDIGKFSQKDYFFFYFNK
jgi:hypothetical protein